MWTYTRKHLDKSLCKLSRTSACLVYFIDKNHHLADSCIVAKCLEVVCDLLYCLMVDSCELSVILFDNILRLCKEIPYTCDESLCSLYVAVVPRL